MYVLSPGGFISKPFHSFENRDILTGPLAIRTWFDSLLTSGKPGGREREREHCGELSEEMSDFFRRFELKEFRLKRERGGDLLVTTMCINHPFLLLSFSFTNDCFWISHLASISLVVFHHPPRPSLSLRLQPDIRSGLCPRTKPGDPDLTGRPGPSTDLDLGGLTSVHLLLSAGHADRPWYGKFSDRKGLSGADATRVIGQLAVFDRVWSQDDEPKCSVWIDTWYEIHLCLFVSDRIVCDGYGT